MNSRIISTTILFLLMWQPMLAATPEDLTLNWRQCQERALLSNPSLAGARYTLDSARYSIAASKNQDLPYPSLSASHAFSRTGTGGSTGSDMFSTNVNASETLFSIKSYADLKTQLRIAEKANLDLRTTLADTRKSLLSSFINLLYAQGRIHVMENILTIRSRSAEMINLQYNSGKESDGNRLRTEAQLAQAEADLTQAKLDQKTAQRSLAADLGMDRFIPMAASGTLTVPSMVSGIDIDEASLAIPGVLASKKSADLAEAKLMLAGADLYPTLSANQGLGWNDSEEFSGSRSWSLGFSMSWPIFSNGPSYLFNSRASSRSLFMKAQADYRAALLSARSSLQSATASLETAIANVHTASLLLEAARQRHEEAEIQYLAGSLNFQNWQDVEQELVSAEQTYLTSLKSVNTARAQVDNLLGIPLGD
ncbi:MAG: TolC family protein [Elusimicrobiota bacterium]